MECKKGKCALSEIYPNTNANIACDCECYFETQQDLLNHYRKQYPIIMKDCGF